LRQAMSMFLDRICLKFRDFTLRGGFPLDALVMELFRAILRTFYIVGGPTKPSRVLPGFFVDDGEVNTAFFPRRLCSFYPSLCLPVHHLSFSGQNDSELVAEIVFEVNKSGIRINVLRTCRRIIRKGKRDFIIQYAKTFIHKLLAQS